MRLRIAFPDGRKMSDRLDPDSFYFIHVKGTIQSNVLFNFYKFTLNWSRFIICKFDEWNEISLCKKRAEIWNGLIPHEAVSEIPAILSQQIQKHKIQLFTHEFEK